MQSKRSPVERFLPVGYFFAAIGLIAAILPSALRPPPQQPPTSAELSPDAPPDDEELLLTELQRANSATAGGPTRGIVPGDGPESLLVRQPPRRSRCFGDPPRQAESLYSAPCAGAWRGDNGGATHYGVTASEIRVAVYFDDLDRETPEGAVDDMNAADSTRKRTYRVFQEYFNRRYEFYGRIMRIFLVKSDFFDSAHGVAAANVAKTQYRAFAVADPMTSNAGQIDEAARLGMVTWTAFQPTTYHIERAPYVWSPLEALERAVSMTDEMICKQLAGKPPAFNQRKDPNFDYAKPRKFGLILYEDRTRYGLGEQVNEELAACGAEPVETVIYNLNEGLGGISGASTRMRAAGVTTVLILGDWFAPTVYLNEAQQQGYFPEYVHYGTGGMASNSLMQGANTNQWRHAIGISMLEIARPREFNDDYIAYKSIDPDRTGEAAALGFAHLRGISNGIQLAGPKLNPETFRIGQWKMPRRPPDPIWSIGGGYYPPDPYTFSKYAGIMWWDPQAVDPGNGNKGAYRWVHGGKRYTAGEVPTEPLPFFKDGIAQPADPRVPD